MTRLLNPDNCEFSLLPQGSPEWLALRQSHRSASDTGSIVGSNPYGSQLAVWKDKLGLGSKFENAAMRNGKAREDETRARYNAATGERVEPAVAINGDYLASLDGMTMDGARNVEVKCPVLNLADPSRTSKWLRAFMENPCIATIPAYYVDQMHHQMAVSGADDTDFYVGLYDENGNHVRDICVEVPYDNERFIVIHTAWENFWPHVEKMDPPVTETVRDDEEWKEAEAEYLAAAADAEKAATALEAAKAKLVALVASDELGTTRGALVGVNYALRKGNVDYTAVPQLQGVDLEPYRKRASTVCTVKAVGGGTKRGKRSA